MATYDLTNQQQGLPWDGRNKLIQLRNYIDFAGNNIGGNAMTTGMTAAQTAEIFDIPEGCILIAVSCRVIKADPSAGTQNTLTTVNTGTDGNQNLMTVAGSNSIDATAAAGTVVLSTLARRAFINTTLLAGGSVLFTCVANPLAVGKLEFQAILLDLRTEVKPTLAYPATT